MLKSVRTVLITMLAGCLYAAAATAEPAPVPAAQTQTLLTAAPLAAVAETAPKLEPAAVVPVVKVGHVDLMRIAAESGLGKAGKAQLEELKKKLQGQVESKRKQLDKQRAAIEAKLQTLSPQQREAKGKEFQKKLEEYQKFGMNAEKELQERQEEISIKLYKEVEQASAEYGKANKLSLVAVRRELLYIAADVEAQDVTDGVIKLIDRK